MTINIVVSETVVAVVPSENSVAVSVTEDSVGVVVSGVDLTGLEIKTLYENNADTNEFSDSEQSKLSGIETNADVTDAGNVAAAGALMDSEVDADIKTLALPENTTISSFGASIIDDANEAAFKATVNLEIGTDILPVASPAMTTPSIDGSKFGSGTSFPGSPSTGDRFFRTDLGFDCYYDGTDWVTVQEFVIGFSEANYSVNSDNIQKQWVGDFYEPKLTRSEVRTRVSTINNASNYWSFQVRSSSRNDTVSNAYTGGTSADSAGAWIDQGGDSLSPSNHGNLNLRAIKTGSPGVLAINGSVYYRKIIP